MNNINQLERMLSDEKYKLVNLVALYGTQGMLSPLCKVSQKENRKLKKLNDKIAKQIAMVDRLEEEVNNIKEATNK